MVSKRPPGERTHKKFEKGFLFQAARDGHGGRRNSTTSIDGHTVTHGAGSLLL